MMRRHLLHHCCRVLLLLLLLVGLLPSEVRALNKVNTVRMDWRMYRSQHFDVYYYQGAEPLIPSMVEELEDAYSYLRELFSVDLSFRVSVITYLYPRHFQETNILPFYLPENIAGFNEPIKNRLVMPLDRSLAERRSLIIHELTHSFQFEFLYESPFSAYFSSPPLWFMEGMAEYTANDYTALGDAVLRDAVVNNAVPPLSRLQNWNALPYPYLGYKIGHEAVAWLVESYGWPRFMSLAREIRQSYFSGGQERAVRETYDVPLSKLSREFQSHLELRTWEHYRRTEDPLLHYGPELVRNKYEYGNFAPALSPSGELLAYLSGKSGRADVYIAPVEPPSAEKEVRDLRKMTRQFGILDIRNVVSEGRPLAWSPDGSRLAVFVRKNEWRALYVIDVFRNRLEREYELRLENANSPAWSPDGRYIAFTGYQQSQSDLYLLDLSDSSLHALTADPEVDGYPAWSPDGTRLAAVVEQGRDSGSGSGLRLLSFDAQSRRAVPLALPEGEWPGNLSAPAWSPDGNTLLLIADGQERVENLTLFHLRDGRSERLTNTFTANGLPSWSPDGNQVVFQSFRNFSYHLYRMPVRELRERRAAEFRARVAPPVPADRMLASSPVPPADPDANTSLSPGDLWLTRGTWGEPSVRLSEFERRPLRRLRPEEPPFYPRFSEPLPSERMPFRLSVDGPSAVGVGVRSDGLFTAQGAVSFSDLVGNHQLSISAYSVAGNQSMYLGYGYLKHRWDLVVTGYRLQDLYYVNFQREFSEDNGGTVAAIYPLDPFFRFEAYVTGGSRNFRFLIYPNVQPKYRYLGTGGRFVADTVRGSFFGPMRGHRFVLGWEHGYGEVGTFDYDIGTVSWSAYWNLFGPVVYRSSMAGRFAFGDRRLLGSIGGYGTVRGYDYGSMTGTHLAWMTQELQFPIVQVMVVPLLGVFHVRGHVFFDAGLAWFENEQVEPLEIEGGRARFRDLKGSVGLGFRVITGGNITLDFNWASRTDGRYYRPDSKFDFSIGFLF